MTGRPAGLLASESDLPGSRDGSESGWLIGRGPGLASSLKTLVSHDGEPKSRSGTARPTRVRARAPRRGIYKLCAMAPVRASEPVGE